VSIHGGEADKGWLKTVITLAGAYVAQLTSPTTCQARRNQRADRSTWYCQPGLDLQVRPGVTLGQLAGNCTTCNFSDGFRSAARRKSRMFRAEARRCLMAYGAIKMANLVRDHHVDPVAPLGHKGTRSNVRPRPARRQIPAAAA
jgi:hypothetical protein